LSFRVRRTANEESRSCNCTEPLRGGDSVPAQCRDSSSSRNCGTPQNDIALRHCGAENALGQAGARRLELNDLSLQLGVAAIAVLALSVCALLPPDPSGFGTHARLGLGQCGHIKRCGVPCAACGATTSVCWLVRGDARKAFELHPGGALVGVAVALSIPFSILCALMGWRWLPHIDRVSFVGWVAAGALFVGLMTIGWPQRIERYLKYQEATQAHVQPAFKSETLHADAH